MKRSLSLLLSGATILSLFAVSAIPASADQKQGLTRDETLQVIDTKKQVTVNSVSIDSNSISTVSKLIDANYNSKMEGNLNSNEGGGKGAVTFELSQPETLEYYVIYTANDTKAYPDRHPDSWVLSGSNDKETWAELDNVTNPNIQAVNYEAFGYQIDNPGSYQYYKLELTKNSGQFIQFGEIELYTGETTQNPHVNSVAGDRTYVKTTYTTTLKNDCAFIDGNIVTAVNIPTLLGLTDDITKLNSDYFDEVLDQLTVYIDDEEAKLNDSYLGYTHSKWKYGDGRLLIGVVEGGLKKDQTYTVTILIGDNYYTDFSYKATATTLRVLDSDTTYYSRDKSCTSVVTFADENHGYTVDQTITSQIHDEHNNLLSFKVTEVNGSTVTFVCENFTTTHSLLEMNKGNDTAFSIPIDHSVITETQVGYFQTREGEDGKFDLRIVVEGNKDHIKTFNSAKITATFTLTNGGTRVITSEDTVRAYTSVRAAGETYEASYNCGLFGVVIAGIPYTEVSGVSVSVTYTNGEGDTAAELGSTDLGVATTKVAVTDVKNQMTKYDASNITVTDSTTGKGLTEGEGPAKLFDGTTTKFGVRKDNFSISFNTAEPITISGLIFTIANDSNSSNRTFAAWAIYGKNAAGKWVLVAKSDTPITKGTSKIDSGKDPDTIADSNREAYTVEYAGSYSEYRIDIVGGSNCGYDGYNQMGELTLYTK